jgi:hypothetical protein
LCPDDMRPARRIPRRATFKAAVSEKMMIAAPVD